MKKTKAEGKKKDAVMIPQDSSIDGLMKLALKSNSGLDQMEKLIQMKYRHEDREARKDFFSAMSMFQADVGVMLKSGTVDFTNKANIRTNYNYATLGQIEKQIKNPMGMCGLSKRFEIQDAEKIKVTCIITHINGHSEKTSMEAIADTTGNKNTIQSRASTVTYLQRYTLIGALGLVTANEDNDAQTSDTKPQKTDKPIQPKQGPVLPPEKGVDMQAQGLIIKALWDKMKGVNPDKFNKKYLDHTVKFVANTTDIKSLTGEQLQELTKELEGALKAELEANKNGRE